jgi:hypothetical protein
MDYAASCSAILMTELAVRVRDISAAGLQLETRRHLSPGTIGVIDVEFDGRRRLEWFRVCRVQALQGRSGVQLIAAEFLPLAPAGVRSLRGAIRRFLARRQP